MSTKSKAAKAAKIAPKMVQLFRFADRLITEPMPVAEAEAIKAGYPGEYADYPLADDHLIALGLAADPANQPAPEPLSDGEEETPAAETPTPPAGGDPGNDPAQAVNTGA